MALPEFDENLAREVVSKALLSVADFSDPAKISEFNFRLFNDFHKKVFLQSLKENVQNIKDADEYYDIILTQDLFDGWTTLQDCIDYVKNKNILRLTW